MATVDSINRSSLNVFSNTYGEDNSAQKQQIDFLAMLMVQLKNQDPSKPFDNQQFSAQLATFSQLEQLTDIRKLMEDQADIFALMAMSMENTSLPSMIGKYASATSDTLDIDGINPSEIGYKVNIPGTSGKATIYDSAGRVIRTIDLPTSKVTTGEHTIEWDGKDNNGDRMLPGKYRVVVEATESDGSTTKLATQTVGKVEAVRYKSTGTVVVINGVEVSLSAINDIRETPY
jgi:flagellar basal-body rod modification protein FlgD